MYYIYICTIYKIVGFGMGNLLLHDKIISQVQCLIEPVSQPCVGAQVKYGSHVVIWMACKRTHNQYETSCGFSVPSIGMLIR